MFDEPQAQGNKSKGQTPSGCNVLEGNQDLSETMSILMNGEYSLVFPWSNEQPLKQ